MEPFQFEPTYPPGEESIESEEDEGEDHPKACASCVRTVITNWCICGEYISMPTTDERYCCQELEELNQKFGNPGWFSVLLC